MSHLALIAWRHVHNFIGRGSRSAAQPLDHPKQIEDQNRHAQQDYQHPPNPAPTTPANPQENPSDDQRYARSHIVDINKHRAPGLIRHPQARVAVWPSPLVVGTSAVIWVTLRRPRFEP